MNAFLDKSRTITLTYFRQNLEAVFDDVQQTGESVFITKYGKPFLVVTHPDLYEDMVGRQKIDASTIHSEWPANYFETISGSLPDPTFKRQPQGDYQKREPLDD